MKSITPDLYACPGKAVYESVDARTQRKIWVVKPLYWDMEENNTLLVKTKPNGLNMIKPAKWAGVELTPEEAVNLAHVLTANAKRDGYWNENMIE